MNIRRVKYSVYFGFVARGNKNWDFLNEPQDSKLRHIRRALWLSAKVENNATFGTVQSYDGCGMSGGLEHQVAVYPRNLSSQGTIFKTINTFPAPTLQRLTRELTGIGWEINPNTGMLVNKTTGKMITGEEIRDEFTPVSGVVPASGPFFERGKIWIEIFAELFSDPRTFEAQILAGEQRIGSFDALERNVYGTRLSAGSNIPKNLKCTVDVNNDEDLALCVYHCFKVNAPAVARTCLKATAPYNDNLWPQRLINTLAIKQYGNWDTRYKKTRSIAMNSGLWPQELFGQGGIMPEYKKNNT